MPMGKNEEKRRGLHLIKSPWKEMKKRKGIEYVTTY